MSAKIIHFRKNKEKNSKIENPPATHKNNISDEDLKIFKSILKKASELGW